jgi:GNAT superfamily N-acetyltransferase
LDVVIEPIAEDPDPAAHVLMFNWLGEDNSRKAGREDRSDFAVLIRDPETSAVIGGLWGADDFGWAFIDLLYVPPSLRGQRIGERLMHEAEVIARGRGMIGLWLNTFDFQARGFYEKLGYTAFGSLESEGEAAGQFFLKKRLPQEQAFEIRVDGSRKG